MSHDHDDRLFVTQLLTGFFALMCLGELVTPDDKLLLDPCKITARTLVALSHDDYYFFQPSHKPDNFFEGNTIIVQQHHTVVDPLSHFKSYLQSRDHLFPFSSALWLRADGSLPTHSFFIDRLHFFFDSDVAGQSLRSGGATSLALNGIPPHLIQAISRWASTAFQIYIQKNPVLLQAMHQEKVILVVYRWLHT